MRFFYMGVIVPIAVVIPLSIAFIYFGKLRRVEKIPLVYLLLSGICNAIGHYLAERGISNLYLQHIFTCVEILLVCLFFREALTNRTIRKWLPVVAAVFICAAVLNSLFIQKIAVHNSYARSVSALITIALCLYFFKTKLAVGFNWKREPLFWFVTGFLIYFSSSLFLFILSNLTFVTMSKQLAWILWDIHATMVLIMYLLFAAGFWYAKRNR